MTVFHLSLSPLLARQTDAVESGHCDGDSPCRGPHIERKITPPFPLESEASGISHGVFVIKLKKKYDILSVKYEHFMSILYTANSTVCIFRNCEELYSSNKVQNFSKKVSNSITVQYNVM
jgi:hypothetical protein